MSLFCGSCTYNGLCSAPYLDCITGERKVPCDKLREKHGNTNGCGYFRIYGCKR